MSPPVGRLLAKVLHIKKQHIEPPLSHHEESTDLMLVTAIVGGAILVLLCCYVFAGQKTKLKTGKGNESMIKTGKEESMLVTPLTGETLDDIHEMRLHGHRGKLSAQHFQQNEHVKIGQDGRRAAGNEGAASWSATTSTVLGSGPASIEIGLVKKSGSSGSFGVLKAGADLDCLLGSQEGGVGLLAGGFLKVDGAEKKGNLGVVAEGSTVRIEYEVGKLVWKVDGVQVHELVDDFSGYSFAVGGYKSFQTFEVSS